MKKGIAPAAQLHNKVPPDWYYKSIQENMFQRYWHGRRFSEVTRLIEVNPKANILDIGSADGVFTKKILDKSNAKEIIGIDVLKTSIDWANKHWSKEKRMKFEIGDAHKLKFKSDTFDAVFAFEVLEHVVSPEEVLREIKRILKSGGYAIFLVPTDSLLFKTGWDLVWTKTRGKIWDETHIQSFTKSSLPNLAKKVGYKVEVDKEFILGMLHLIKVRKI